MKENNNIFNSFIDLQNCLRDNENFEVNHAGFRWSSSFQWFPPITIDEINSAEISEGITIPTDYKVFLSNISNGAILFYDEKFGQWGYKLFSLTELIDKQDYWKKNLPNSINPIHLAFGETIGEANVLIFDLTRPSIKGRSFAVLEANAYDPPDEWPIMSRSYHEWLDHLITSQGDKYWGWR